MTDVPITEHSRIEFLELWVEDAESVADKYCRAFGFRRVAVAGPETGLPEHRSIVLRQESARLIITSSLNGHGPVAEFTQIHGDGVRDIAFRVDDAARAFRVAMARGAKSRREPSIWGKGSSLMLRGSIQAFGDVVHSFVQWLGTALPELPAPYRAVPTEVPGKSPSFTAIDHVAVCLQAGSLDEVADFYKRVLGFRDGYKEYIAKGSTGMNSRVVELGTIKFPLQEPLGPGAEGPIGKFVARNSGPGVYHIALLTDDILTALRNLNGVEILRAPPRYYETLQKRVGRIDEDIDALRELDVLVDREGPGYLLQVFTQSLHARKTLFFEVIQRKGGATSFGSGNVRALFDAVDGAGIHSAQAVEVLGGAARGMTS